MTLDRARYVEAFERLLAAWVGVVLRHRARICIAVAMVTGLAIHALATRLRVEPSMETMLAGDDPAQEHLEEYRVHFGRDEVLLVLIEGDVFSADFLRRLQALEQALEEIDVPIEASDRQATADVIAVPAAAAPQLRFSGQTPDDTGELSDEAFELDDASFEVEGDPAGVAGSSGWGAVRGGSIFHRITSIVSARRTTGSADGIRVGRWGDLLEQPDGPEALRREALADALVAERLVSRSGRHAVIALRTMPMDEESTTRVYQAVLGLVESHRADGFAPSVGGAPALRAAYTVVLRGETGRLMLFAVGAMVLLLIVMFRSPVGVLGPLLVVAVATIWTLGGMAVLGIPITLLTNWVPAFVLSIGIADTVHIQIHYRQLRAEGVARSESIKAAFGGTGLPCILTTLTTALGLVSFTSSSATAVRQLGVVAAMGVSFALVLTMLLLPVILSHHRRGLMGGAAGGTRGGWVLRVVNRCGRLSASTRARRSVYVIAILLSMAAAAIIAMRVSFMHDRLRFLPSANPTVQAFRSLDEHAGGAGTLDLLVRARTESGLKDLRVLRELERIEQSILRFEHPEVGRIVLSSTSLLDVVRETNRALHSGDRAHHRLPASDRAVSDALFLFENAGRDHLQQLVTPDYLVAGVTFRVKWLDASRYQHLIAHVDSVLADVPPDLAEISVTGSVLIDNRATWTMVVELARSFLVAVLAISVLMIVALGDLRLGLLAMAPNVLPILWTLGGMTALGVPLNLGYLLVGTIAIGLVVDDTIHFFHQFRRAHARRGQVDASIEDALTASGVAIVTTTVVLGLGFLVYADAKMPVMRNFGYLAATIMVLALLLNVVLGPALIRSRIPTRSPRTRGAPKGSRDKPAESQPTVRRQ